MRRLAVYLGIMLITVAAGLTVRFLPLGLPWFVVKYGGSTLWAVMIYWSVSALMPSRRPFWLALLAGVAATLIELSRLWHIPSLDAFRETLAGVILLGKYFSLRNILAYWLAIFAGALLDRAMIRPRLAGLSPQP